MNASGFDAFHDSVAFMSALLRDWLDEIKSWDDVKLLTVAVNRLARWHKPGLHCIAAAAHAMSPIGGVGVNLAIQDAVAATNLLAAPLKEGRVTADLLDAVQRRRTMPMRVIQWLQVQDNVLSAVLAGSARPKPPLPARLMKLIPARRRIPARIVGLGIRLEHVRMSEASAARDR